MSIVTEQDILRGRDLLAQLGVVLVKEQRTIFRGRARLHPRVPPPQALRPGESYDVDLARATFEHRLDDALVTELGLQVIGTFVPGADDPDHGVFAWGWHNPSVPERAQALLHRWIRHDLDLAGLASLRGFEVARWRVQRLVQLIAVRFGALGAYPAITGGTTAFLALRTEPHADAHEPGRAPWCLVCGEVPAPGEALAEGAWGGICHACAAELEPDLRLIEAEQRPSPASNTYGQGECFLCGAAKHAIPLAYGAIHGHCVARTTRHVVSRGSATTTRRSRPEP